MFKYAQIWRKAPYYFLAALCAALISAAPSAAQNTADEKQAPTIKPQISRRRVRVPVDALIRKAKGLIAKRRRGRVHVF